jgi:hypothetical protein
MSPRGEIAFPMRTLRGQLADLSRRACALLAPTVATQRVSRYIQMKLNGKIMRAEIEKLVGEIKQSVGPLRRHL